jgi:hypothetical protein
MTADAKRSAGQRPPAPIVNHHTVMVTPSISTSSSILSSAASLPPAIVQLHDPISMGRVKWRDTHTNSLHLRASPLLKALLRLLYNCLSQKEVNLHLSESLCAQISSIPAHILKERKRKQEVVHPPRTDQSETTVSVSPYIANLRCSTSPPSSIYEGEMSMEEQTTERRDCYTSKKHSPSSIPAASSLSPSSTSFPNTNQNSVH